MVDDAEAVDFIECAYKLADGSLSAFKYYCALSSMHLPLKDSEPICGGILARKARGVRDVAAFKAMTHKFSLLDSWDEVSDALDALRPKAPSQAKMQEFQELVQAPLPPAMANAASTFRQDQSDDLECLAMLDTLVAEGSLGSFGSFGSLASLDGLATGADGTDGTDGACGSGDGVENATKSTAESPLKIRPASLCAEIVTTQMDKDAYINEVNDAILQQGRRVLMFP